MVAFGIIGFTVLNQKGFPGSSDDVIRNNFLDKIKKQSSLKCNNIFQLWNNRKGIGCRFQKEEGKNTIALIGDSHAGHLFAGLTQVTQEDEGVIVFSASCAAPFIDMMTGTRSDYNVRKYNWQAHREAYSYIFKHPEIKTVVLGHSPICSFNDVIDRQNPEEKDPRRMMENGIRRTFNALREADKKVLVVLDNPRLPFEPRSCVARPFIKPRSGIYNRRVHDNDKPHTVYNEQISRISEDYPNVSVIDLSSKLCDSKNCYAVKNGKLLYQDVGHLNNDGSLYVAPFIMQKIREISK